MKRCMVFLVAGVLAYAMQADATIINVPGDQPTIQAGINASVDGDTILVQPDTYVENINFNGHNVVLASLFLTTQDTSYISSTIIDGDYSGAVFTFENGEDSTAQIIGFTIVNGNVGGIHSVSASPQIKFNAFIGNYCNGNGGGLIFVGATDLLIVGNEIAYDTSSNNGGAMSLDNCSGVTIAYNNIHHNYAQQAPAIWVTHSAGSIHHNLVTDNIATGVGSAIILYSDNDVSIYNNTICNNSDFNPKGAIYIVNNLMPITVYNNIVAFNNSRGIGQSNSAPIDAIYNDVFDNTYGNYYNLFADPTDISLDPLFLGGAPYDYHLQEVSSCINAGNPSSPFDPYGSYADMGAYYFHLNYETIYVSVDGDDENGDGSQENPFATIQHGIDMASYFGDTVSVFPGTYYEHVNFLGKAIIARSSDGPENTVISKAYDGVPIVTLESGEDTLSVLEGFTIQNAYDASGIEVNSGSAGTFKNNIITNNSSYGIECSSNSRIFSNDISSNGNGIICGSNTYISSNIVRSNSTYGVSFSGENVRITGNTFFNNQRPIQFGGSGHIINGNIIYGNIHGGGDGAVRSSGSSSILFENNTICDNACNDGLRIQSCTQWAIKNNIIVNNNGYGIRLINPSNISMTYNDVYGNESGDYYGGVPGTGSISEDPLFLDPNSNDYSLTGGSPCIDAGDPSSPYDPDGTITDMGALYFDQTYRVLNFHLIEPLNETILLDPIPSFVWHSTSDNGPGYPIEYYHYLDDDPVFGSPYESVALSDTVYIFPEQLARSMEYYWRVLATNNDAPPTYSSETWSFYIDGYPTMPEILGPENGSEADAETYLSWLLGTDPDPMDTVSYSLQADDDDQFGSPEIDASGITPTGAILDEAMAIMLGDLPGFENLQEDQIYYWRVRSDDLFGLSSDWTDGTNYIYFMPHNHAPNPPVSGFSPADGEEVISLTPLITWDDATDPDQDDNGDNLSYAIRLSLTEDFSGFVYSDTTDPGINQIQPEEELEDNSHYFYGIMTIDDEGLSSEWSETQNFWTNHYNYPPEPFPLYAPDDSTNHVVYYTHFTWGNTVDYDPLSSFTFTFEYSTNDLFEDPVVAIEELTDTTLTVETDELALLGPDLYWRILAVDDDGLTRIGGLPDEEIRFLRIRTPGDMDGDGVVYLTDIIYLIAYYRGQVPPPDPLLVGDLDGDCNVGISDIIYLIAYYRGQVPPPPRPDCEPQPLLMKWKPTKEGGMLNEPIGRAIEKIRRSIPQTDRRFIPAEFQEVEKLPPR